MKRNSLSLKRKIEVIEAVEKYPNKKKATIADEFQIHPSTVTTLLKDRDKYKEQFYSGTVDPEKQKRFRLAKHEEVDKQLFAWFTCARSEDLPMNGPILKAKAEELSKPLGILNWKCSDGWLYRWKKRHGIIFRAVTDERATVEEQATDNWVEDILLHTLEWYESRNIFNLGITALFWRLLPDKMCCLKGDKCHAGQKSKERLTVMLCCNMDGSEKMPLVTIGKFKKPQCFTGLKTLPVQYTASPKAWMTADIFKEWLQSFDTAMERQNRKVLLVLDKCPTNEVPELTATEVLFLPRNAVSKLQPCDLGIVQNLKVCYRRMKVLKLMAHTNAGGAVKDYQFSLLDAVCTLKCAWDNVNPSTISSCFCKAGFKAGETTNTSADHLPDLIENATQEPLMSRLFEEWNVSPLDYFSVDDSVATMEPVRSTSWTTIQTPSTSVTSSPEELHSDKDDDCGDQREKVSRKTLMDCMKTVHTYCLQTGCSDIVMNSFNDFAQTLDKHLAQASYQTKITHFFGKSRVAVSKQREGQLIMAGDCEWGQNGTKGFGGMEEQVRTGAVWLENVDRENAEKGIILKVEQSKDT